MTKQRGYSPVVIGFMFTIFTIPGLLLKPIVGVTIDKYKCHKLIIILGAIIKCIVVCVLIFVPSQTEEKELEDMVVIKSPIFWLFSCCLFSLKTVFFVKTVVDDTICMGLLGKIYHQMFWCHSESSKRCRKIVMITSNNILVHSFYFKLFLISFD